METLEVTLPLGLVRSGSRQRAATLRPLLGRDELFLCEEARTLTPAASTTRLLARCIERLGDFSPVDEDDVRSLAVGDREALLLQLRRLTHGERISLVLTCPNQECGEAMDLDLSVADLLQTASTDIAFEHEISVEVEDHRYRVCFRLPTGADLEAVAALARDDVQRAAKEILRRCVIRIAAADGSDVEFGTLAASAFGQIEQAMAALDPQADLQLDLVCPCCDAHWLARFDTGAFVMRELGSGSSDLFREVHALALHYHWSESEILDLPRGRRHLYLNLLFEMIPAWSVR
jgi:hypothetical protein